MLKISARKPTQRNNFGFEIQYNSQNMSQENFRERGRKLSQLVTSLLFATVKENFLNK